MTDRTTTPNDTTGQRPSWDSAKRVTRRAHGRKAKQPGRQAVSTAATDELRRLRRAAAKDPQAAEYVAALAAAGREHLETRHARGALTGSEVDALTSLGGVAVSATAVKDDQVRSALAITDLYAESLTNRDVAELLGVTGQRISQRATEGTLYSFGSRTGRRFPAWQFTDGGAITGLAGVLAAFPAGIHPLTVAAFMTAPDVDLDLDGHPVSPREWLIAGGDPAAVARLAEHL